MKILLNKSKNKNSTNVNNNVNIGFENKTRLLPLLQNETTLNLIDLYNKERNDCTKIRLTCTINPICSNVLFNNVTEIVKNEGSKDVDILNYSKELKVNSGIIYDTTKEGKGKCSEYDAVRNTEFSREEVGYDYHCGLDIFNNHLLRSTTFKTVCNKGGDKFNTIEDMMRDIDGKQIKGYKDEATNFPSTPNLDLHLYSNEEINDFKTTVNNELIEKNGWFGFTNKGKMLTYENFDKSIPLNISCVINSKRACEFINMYPTKDLFSFNPKYNSYRNKLEKNWNYCITYPSESTKENIPFIHNTTNGLKVIYFDEYVKSYNGLEVTVMYSISKHGLKEGDTVNIYRGSEVFFRNAKVASIQDDYIFTIYKNGRVISEQWIVIDYDNKEKEYTSSDGRTFKTNSAQRLLIDNSTNATYPIVNGRCNVDLKSQDISYKRVVDGNEDEYYVRIFSRLPNFKFADTIINSETLYGKDVDETNNPITKYQKLNYEFENTIGKAAFAKNAYGDDITQIIFTDDISFKYLKDNLGRPLSELYLTIIKNNRGYKEWYGKNKKDGNLESLLTTIHKTITEAQENDEDTTNPTEKKLVGDIEYSHAFGKVNCAFKLSDESIVSDFIYPNITTINNVDNKKGMKIPEYFRNSTEMLAELRSVDNDEIDYYRDVKFYGDLCSFTKTEFKENIIQPILHRFNTAQRELTTLDAAYTCFNTLEYDNLLSDDYDSNGFKVKKETFNEVCKRREGYYYQPHYQIKVRTISDTISIENPMFYPIKGFKNIFKNGENMVEITTMNKHQLNKDDKFMFYDSKANIYYYGIVKYIITSKIVCCTLKTIDGKSIGTSVIPPFRNYKMFKPTEDIPDYAQIVTDGTCRYIWRNVYSNGMDKQSKDEVYPFTNGALYPHIDIRLYLRRQDPNNISLMYSSNGSGMQSVQYPYDQTGNFVLEDNLNQYYNKDEIQC